MILFFSKIAVTISIVLGLSVVAERISPRWAGVLGGYPLGVAIALIFVGLEQGPDFAAQGAVHTVVGLIANLSIFATYGVVVSLWRSCPFYIAVLCGLISFGLVGYGLSLIPFTLLTALAVSMGVIVMSIFAFRGFPETKITQAVRLSPWVAAVRACVACGVVLAITGLAKALGPQLSGVLAGFPSTVLPLVVIIHATYGPAPVVALIKHFPKGLGSTVFFSAVYAFMVADFGVLWSSLSAFAVATFYLLGLQYIQTRR